MTGMTDLMESLGNGISNFNKEIRSVGTSIFARGGNPVNPLPKLFATYDNFSFHNGPFARYIEMLENQYNNRTLNLKPKDLM